MDPQDRRPPSAEATRRRPPAVTILAGIELLSAILYGSVFLALLLDPSAAQDVLGIGPSTGVLATVEVAALQAVVGGFFVAATAGGILLLRVHRLGWTITMLLTGVGLASAIYTWLTEGSVLSVWLLVQVVTVFYLNVRQVRQAFGITGRTADPATLDARG